MYHSEDMALASRGAEVIFSCVFKRYRSANFMFPRNGMSCNGDIFPVYTFDYWLSFRAIESTSSSKLFCFVPSTSFRRHADLDQATQSDQRTGYPREWSHSKERIEDQGQKVRVIECRDRLACQNQFPASLRLCSNTKR